MTASRVNDSTKKPLISTQHIKDQLLRYAPIRIYKNQLEQQLPKTVKTIYNEEQKANIFIFNSTHNSPISAPTDDEVMNMLCYGTSEEPNKYSDRDALLHSLC